MAKHLFLSIDKFITSIPPDYLKHYFETIHKKLLNQGWEWINPDAVKYFLADPENADAAGIIMEDFQKINDLGQEGMNFLVQACQKNGVPIQPEETPLQLSMRLFLDHKYSFDFAWSRFLLYNAPAKLSIYPLNLNKELIIESQQIQAFEKSVQNWYTELAKGEQCIVKSYEDKGETVILVRHGSYIRNTPFWDGNEVSINSYRPAIEDVLSYDPAKSQLFVKATLAKDREEYLRLFASQIIGDESIADQAIKDVVFTLIPLQDESFNFAGEGPIAKIELVKVRMNLYGISNPVIELKADDILTAFQNDLGSLTLKSGILTMARFRFHLRFPGQKAIKVTFEINPPFSHRFYTKKVLPGD